MDGQSIALWAALVGLAAVLLDRRARGDSGSVGGLTVRGADVSIDASNKVETRTVWQFVGASDGGANPKADTINTTVNWDPVVGEGLRIRAKQLFSGRIRRSALIKPSWHSRASWDAALSTYYDTWWVPQIVTLGEAIDLHVVEIPTKDIE